MDVVLTINKKGGSSFKLKHTIIWSPYGGDDADEDDVS